MGALWGGEYGGPARNRRAARRRGRDGAVHLYSRREWSILRQQGRAHPDPGDPLTARPPGPALSSIDGAEDYKWIIPRPAARCTATHQRSRNAEAPSGIDAGVVRSRRAIIGA